ncbi:MAG: transposase, partial [Muribaculaceae bacterium]|nr:transposase [Muribaculaceae bacterium]
NLVRTHTSQVVEPKDLSKVLPWVHIVISNAKRQLLDIHHDVREDYLQQYLDEFCYKFNRRYLDVFERLMLSCMSYKNEFKHRVYAKVS